MTGTGSAAGRQVASTSESAQVANQSRPLSNEVSFHPAADVIITFKGTRSRGTKP